jgi:hypothetical protein
MRRKIVIGSVFIMVLAISAGFFLYNKPSERIVSAKARYSLHATQLYNEFDKSEAAANAKYLNTVVSVRGVIREISPVDRKGVTIVLETKNPLFGVSCQLPNGNKGEILRRGQEVQVKGLCTGKLMDVVLMKCIIQTKNKQL